MRKYALFILFLLLVGSVFGASYYDTLNQTMETSGSFNQCVFYRFNSTIAGTAGINITGITKDARATPTTCYLFLGNALPGSTPGSCNTGATQLANGSFAGNTCIFTNFTSPTNVSSGNFTIAIDKVGVAWTQYYNATPGTMPANGNTSIIRWLGASSDAASPIDTLPRSITGVFFNDVNFSNIPLLCIGVNDTRSNSLVNTFTVNMSNSTYSKTLSTTGSQICITAKSLNATNSSLTLALNNASFFNGSYRDSSQNQVLATLTGKTLNSGQIINNTRIVLNSSGRYGNSFTFSGVGISVATSTDRIDLGNQTYTQFNDTTKFTLGLWLYSDGVCGANSTHNVGLLARNFRYGLHAASGCRPFIQMRNASLAGSAVGPSTNLSNGWHHVVGTYNLTHLALYIDGILNNTGSQTIVQIDSSSSNLTIGNMVVSSGQNRLNASIDEVRIWNTSLNVTEINDEMNSAFPVRGANLVASYSFELNNITAGATGNYTADTSYLVNSTVGTLGGAYYFDPNLANELDLGESYNVSVNGFTLNAWANSIGGVSAQRILYKRSSNNGYLMQRQSTWVCGAGNGTDLILPSATATSNNNTMITCVYNGSTISIYTNGIFRSSLPLVNFVNSNTNLVIGGQDGSNTFNFNGSISDVRVYNRALSAQEVADLYNGVDFGTGFYNVSFSNVHNGTYFNTTSYNVNFSNQGSDGLGNTVLYGQDFSNWLNLTLSNIVNNTNLTDYTVSINNGSSTVSASTTIGSVILYNIIGNLTINYTTIQGSTYFNQSYSLSNFNSTNANFTNTTYQALLNVSAYRLFLNTTISQFNTTNNKVTNTSPVANYSLIFVNNGSNNLQVDVAGNYSLNYTCTVSQSLTTSYCNVTGIYDNVFTIGGNTSGTSVSTFTVNVTNSTLEGQLYSISTTNGSIDFPLLQGYWYYFFMNPPAYSLANVTIPANASTNRYNFTILQQNAFELGFYNETTNTLLNNVNITIQLISNDYANNYTTSNGTLLVTLLTPGEYTIRYWDDPGVPREYYVTLTNQSYNNISLYILDASISQFYLPVINNEFTSAVSGATVELLRYYVGTNTYKIVEMAKTDTNGQAVIRVVPNTIAYKLFVQKGSTTMTTAPTKFTSTTNTYTLSFTQNILTSFTAMPSVTKSLTYNNATLTYTFSWSDTNNLITSGCLIVTAYNSSGTYQAQNTCSNGAIGSIIYTITNTNNTRYSAIGTLETNTEFSTYTFGPVEVDFDTTPQAIFGLVGFIILLLILLTVGFLANDIGADATIFSVIGILLLLGMVHVIGYTWSNYVGIFIIGFILLYKIYR